MNWSALKPTRVIIPSENRASFFKYFLLILIFLSTSGCSHGSDKSESEQLLDLPDPLRGILLFAPEITGDAEQTVQNFKKLVVLLKAKRINFVLFDMHWGNFRYQNTPGIKVSSKKAIDAELAAELSNIAKDAGMTVGVGMNFLTHQAYGVLVKNYPKYAWLGKDGKKLAADPRTKEANLWDPLNPEVNKIAFLMADELIDAFKPSVFHVGLDEPWGFDADNLLSNKQNIGTNQLFAKLINEYHAHIVKKRDLSMMMWADSFEPLRNRPKGLGATAVLDDIPKDIILSYWNYGEYSEYAPMRMFAKKGFRVTASPWNDPAAAKALLIDAHKLRKTNKNMIGVLYTIWTPGVLSNLAPALENKDGGKMKEIAAVIEATNDLLLK